MTPQKVLAAIEDAVRLSWDAESSRTRTASVTSSNDSQSSLNDAKFGPQEVLRMLEEQTDSTNYHQLVQALQQMNENDDDGDFDICLDDIIPPVFCTER